MAKPVVSVSVFSDLACPWCWVGHRRLSAAMESYAQAAEVQPEWHAYLLDPDCPEAGEDIMSALKKKFGPSAPAMMERVKAAGAEAGAPFADWKWRASTIPGHILVAAARKQGRTHEAERLLFEAAFERGRCLTDGAVLSEAAAALGLGDSAEAVIGSAAGGWDAELRREVLEDDALAKQGLRITGVPFFIISSGDSKKYAVSGAQPVDVFVELFDRVLKEGGGGGSSSGGGGGAEQGDAAASCGVDGACK